MSRAVVNALNFVNVARALAAMAAMLALAGSGACRKAGPEGPDPASGPSALASAPARPAPPPQSLSLVRGVVVLSSEAPRITPCGEAEAIPLRDDTGGPLAAAYGELASEQTGEAWFELRATRSDRLIAVAEVVRALPIGEGSPCDRLPAAGELRASGNEPFWAITVTPAGIELREPDRAEPLVFPAAEPVAEGPVRTWTARIDSPEPHEIRLVVAPRLCKDGMSGAWSALAAEAVIDGRAVAGCAHEGG